MTAPRIELADIVRRYGRSFLDAHEASLPFDQTRILTDIAECRTAALGGHIEALSIVGVRAV